MTQEIKKKREKEKKKEREREEQETNETYATKLKREEGGERREGRRGGEKEGGRK